jgi:hypothetical protein
LSVTKKQIADYGDIFLHIINNQHKEKNMCWQPDTVIIDKIHCLTIVSFKHGKKRYENGFIFKTNDLSDYVLSRKRQDTENDFHYYYQDGFDFVFISRNHCAYSWSKTAAIADADKVIYDYFEAGY